LHYVHEAVGNKENAAEFGEDGHLDYIGSNEYEAAGSYPWVSSVCSTRASKKLNMMCVITRDVSLSSGIIVSLKHRSKECDQ
jgi:hypothetical protein